ncbi:DnaB-like helicase N-terminal domain-containing protein, partial [Acinetobacter guillouiae]|uniref:DnaB-like helicase N-terminal domain-containing protein n=1 Tax=Acinetobacter guillouiae TaxID=106649 RepID=UPI003AF8F624
MIELFSIPVEQAILSTVIGTEQGMDEYIEQIDSSDFYAAQHQIIWTHVKSQFVKGEGYDQVMIWELIRANAVEVNAVDEKFILNLMGCYCPH